MDAAYIGVVIFKDGKNNGVEAAGLMTNSNGITFGRIKKSNEEK